MVAALVVLSVIVMISIGAIIERRKKSVAVASRPVFDKGNLLAPAGYYFSNGHTWAKESEDGIKIGFDSFILNSLGAVTLNKILPEGTSVNKGQTIFECKFNDKNFSLKSPISGIVKKVNNSIFGKSINGAYEENWGVVINTEDKKQLSMLRKGDEAVKWMKSEFKRLKDFLSIHSFAVEPVGATMYDGGNVVKGAVSMLSSSTLDEFEEQFLNIQ